MCDEKIVQVVQASIDGFKIVRQHKEYCGKYWFEDVMKEWDFVNYYYRVLQDGETYKNSNNETTHKS